VIEDPSSVNGPEEPLVEIVSTNASQARVFDYMMGGDDNFAVDRATAELVAEDVGGMDKARAGLVAQRLFQDATLRRLAGELQLRQFIEIGAGIPDDEGLPAVVQQVAPEARVVYVDNDPLVLAHAHSLLKSTPEGSSAFVNADLREPERILKHAAATLDMDEPAVLVLVGILHLVSDEDQPHAIVARLLEAFAPGSHVVISHATGEIQREEMARLAKDINDATPGGLSLRSRDQVSRFFDGLQLLEPGLVSMEGWLEWHGSRPEGTGPGAWEPPYYIGIGRKS
jgi:O-methyltransferase involved in polyketide biosynthesis